MRFQLYDRDIEENLFLQIRTRKISARMKSCSLQKVSIICQMMDHASISHYPQKLNNNSSWLSSSGHKYGNYTNWTDSFYHAELFKYY